MGGSSQFKFGILAKIVKHMKVSRIFEVPIRTGNPEKILEYGDLKGRNEV